MTIRAKICGLNDPVAVRAAVDGGAVVNGDAGHPSIPQALIRAG